jgi:hypothetical protein
MSADASIVNRLADEQRGLYVGHEQVQNSNGQQEVLCHTYQLNKLAC